MSAKVLISIVTYNSALYLRRCLESVAAQSHANCLVCIWDNASTDTTADVIAQFVDRLDTAHFSTANVGFCAAHNRVIATHDADYVLVLNPDVELSPGFVEALVAALERDKAAGSASGKLWRYESAVAPAPTLPNRILDTTGIYLTPNQRHLDRGSGEIDNGQYDRMEYVFGASGAAACYRRTMLDDVRLGDQYFDEDFFAYREDADLAWRAQWLGWSCLYVPHATGFHVRRVLPERRRALPGNINMHSFKNRFLMRIKNMDAGTYAWYFLPITARDLGALAYVLTREWHSLRAIPLLLGALPSAWSARKALQRHRRVSPKQMRTWFSRQAAAKPGPAAGLVQVFPK